MSAKNVVWGDKILDAGFTMIPNLLIDHQHDLNLSSEELIVIIHVFRYKFSSDDPYPRNSTIQSRMNCSERTLQRIISSLKEKGYLIREKVDDWHHTWNFSPLLKHLRRLTPGHDSDTPPGHDSGTTPGHHFGTQNNTSFKEYENKEEEETRARGRARAKEKENPPPPAFLEKGKTETITPEQKALLLSLINERDIPDSLRDHIRDIMNSGMGKSTASEFIDQIKTFQKKKADDDTILCKFWNASKDWLARIPRSKYESIRADLDYHHHHHPNLPFLYVWEDGREEVMVAIAEFHGQNGTRAPEERRAPPPAGRADPEGQARIQEAVSTVQAAFTKAEPSRPQASQILDDAREIKRRALLESLDPPDTTIPTVDDLKRRPA